MQRIVLSACFACLLVGGDVVFMSAQQAESKMIHLPQIRQCDPATMPTDLKHLPVYSRAGAAPVVPEVLREIRKGRNPKVVVAEALRGPTETDTDERKEELIRARARIDAFNQIALFAPPGTDSHNLPPLPPEFQDFFQRVSMVENLEEGFHPCWSVLDFVTESGPDDSNGRPTIRVLDPHTLGWCDTMMDGVCGVWTVKIKVPITVTTGPHAGEAYTWEMIVNCGNPDAQFMPITVTEEVKAPAPSPPPPTPPPAIVIPQHIEVPPAKPETPAIFAESHKTKWPCTGKVSRWVCIGAAGSVPLFFLHGSSPTPPSGPTQTPKCGNGVPCGPGNGPG